MVLHAASDVYVHGFADARGLYVTPHYRRAPDGNLYNNGNM
jgi:hypothetical protein